MPLMSSSIRRRLSPSQTITIRFLLVSCRFRVTGCWVAWCARSWCLPVSCRISATILRSAPVGRLPGRSSTRLRSNFFFDMLISKEPGQLNETPWHNDYAYSGVPVAPPGRISALKSVQFWVALDPVDERNGCMQFIPGSHRLPSPEHFVASGTDDDPGRLLATEDVDPTQAVSCPLPPGGCTVHSTGTLHFTGGNATSDRPRRAYIFNFRKSG